MIGVKGASLYISVIHSVRNALKRRLHATDPECTPAVKSDNSSACSVPLPDTPARKRHGLLRMLRLRSDKGSSWNCLFGFSILPESDH